MIQKKTEKHIVIMPRATAKWLINNTSLSLRQISDFTKIPLNEVHAVKNNLMDESLQAVNPINIGQITMEEIERCENDESEYLIGGVVIPVQNTENKKRYIPKIKRSWRPAALLWVIRNIPNVQEKKIIKIFSTTKTMIQKIKNKEYDHLIPQHPVEIGICTKDDLNYLENN